jgi:hypothetical protein
MSTLDPLSESVPHVDVQARAADPAYQAYQALHLGFVVAPVLAGADKFTHLMTDWNAYLAPQIDRIVPGTAGQLMAVVGIVEIVAGLVVLVAPRVGGYVVAAWLLGIIVNLVLHGGYLDIALRDVGLMLGAFALARLAATFHRAHR